MLKFVVPETESPPRKPAPAGETYMERLRREALEEVAAGRAVSMNDILRSVPAPKFRKPRG